MSFDRKYFVQKNGCKKDWNIQIFGISYSCKTKRSHFDGWLVHIDF